VRRRDDTTTVSAILARRMARAEHADNGGPAAADFALRATPPAECRAALDFPIASAAAASRHARRTSRRALR